MKVFHIRKRLSKKGGSNFYRDKSFRKTETFCGMPVTSDDVSWNCKFFLNNSEFTVCENCLEKRKQEIGI